MKLNFQVGFTLLWSLNSAAV